MNGAVKLNNAGYGIIWSPEKTSGRQQVAKTVYALHQQNSTFAFMSLIGWDKVSKQESYSCVAASDQHFSMFLVSKCQHGC